MIRTTASVLALCVAAAPALADRTPEQVWADLSAYMLTYGYEVTGTLSRQDDTLTVSDAAFAVSDPEEEFDLSVDMETVLLRDNGDGSVSITFPEVVPITLSFEGDEAVEAVITYSHTGLEMTVSGDEKEALYLYKAESTGMSLGSLMVDGAVIPREAARFDVSTGALDGATVLLREDGILRTAQEFEMGDVSFSFAITDPESAANMLGTGSFAAMEYEGGSDIPEGIDMSDIEAVLGSDFSALGEIRHSGGAVEFAATEDGETVTGTVSTQSGKVLFDVTADMMRYGQSAAGMQAQVFSPEIPFPISFGLDENRFDITVPLGEPGAPQEAKLGLTYAGLVLPEVIWNMFDPGAALPRDPATVSFDLSAIVTPFVSIFDEEAMMALGSEAPGELNEITLDGLTVSAGGGEVTGTGSFTFDNSDMETFDGMPRPEGQLDLNVAGLNGLLDALIEMGLMEPGDVMGARMMLSMFTVPGEAEDTATSTITINPEGHVLANGQRIR